VLPAEGAPLVFATQLAYGLTLHIVDKPSKKNNGSPVNLPLKADPSQGGLVLEHPAPPLLDGDLTPGWRAEPAVVLGKWGFDDWEGPLPLRTALPGKWAVTAATSRRLVVGREDQLHIEGETRCAWSASKSRRRRQFDQVGLKSPKPDQLEVAVPMKDASPGRST